MCMKVLEKIKRLREKNNLTQNDMAKVLGYDAHQVAGYVPKIGGGVTPHSWVEIVINGTVYVFDPNFTNETGGNGYQIRYGTSGTWMYSSYYRMN